MSKPSATTSITAICAAQPLPDAGDGAPPEWIHLLPAGEIRTVDGRGPYRVADAAALIAASLQGDARLPLDENHSTDLAAPQGGPSPARGWITEMQPRADGVWGRVEWTSAGKALMADKAYRHISPVIVHDRRGTINGVLRASLVNAPNLRGLTALHHQQQETDMELLAQLRGQLGLPETADGAAVCVAVKGLQDGAPALQQAQTAIGMIAEAAGLARTAPAAEIVTAIQAARDPAKMVPAAQVTALQSQVTGLLREKSERVVDEAIKAGRIGLKPLRDHYVARHLADPAAVEKIVAEIGAGRLVVPEPKAKMVAAESR